MEGILRLVGFLYWLSSELSSRELRCLGIDVGIVLEDLRLVFSELEDSSREFFRFFGIILGFVSGLGSTGMLLFFGVICLDSGFASSGLGRSGGI